MFGQKRKPEGELFGADKVRAGTRCWVRVRRIQAAGTHGITLGRSPPFVCLQRPGSSEDRRVAFVQHLTALNTQFAA